MTRKSNLYIASTIFLAAIFIGLLGFHPLLDNGHRQRWIVESGMVRDLGLTDICLFTEARYTRHLSQADYFAAFQDHPVSLEHFPSGSLVLPPPHLKSARPGQVEVAAEVVEPGPEQAARPVQRSSVAMAGARPAPATVLGSNLNTIQ